MIINDKKLLTTIEELHTILDSKDTYDIEINNGVVTATLISLRKSADILPFLPREKY